MSWLLGIGGVLGVVLAIFFKGKASNWPVFQRRKKTIDAEIEKLDKEKEKADEEREDDRQAAHDACDFDE